MSAAERIAGDITTNAIFLKREGIEITTSANELVTPKDKEELNGK